MILRVRPVLPGPSFLMQISPNGTVRVALFSGLASCLLSILQLIICRLFTLVSRVTDMRGMFQGAFEFQSDLSRWNVAQVQDMSFVFNAAFSFHSDLSGWDVSSVTNMQGMFKVFDPDIFHDPSLFNADISRWNGKPSSVFDLWSFPRCFGNLIEFPILCSLASHRYVRHVYRHGRFQRRSIPMGRQVNMCRMYCMYDLTCWHVAHICSCIVGCLQSLA